MLKCLVENSVFSDISVSDLASLAEVSIPTASKFIEEELDTGFLTESEKRHDSGAKGRKSIFYSINPRQAYFIGVDMKHHFLAVRIIDARGECIREYSNPAFVFSDTPECMEICCSEVVRQIDESGLPKDRMYACFNISGRVDSRNGMSYSLFSFEGNEGIPLSSILSNMVGIPVVIENDTRSMLRGELSLGQLSGYNNLIYVNFGWGLATALLLEGHIYIGSNGFSGEFGHSFAFDNGIVCHCGKKGCLETGVSGRAAVRLIRERLKETDSIKSVTVTDKELLYKIRCMDPICYSIMEDMGRKLGKYLSNMINVLNPEAVILGGGLTKGNKILNKIIEESIHANTLKLLQKNLFIGIGYDADRIGVIGACLTARENYFQNRILSVQRP